MTKELVAELKKMNITLNDISGSLEELTSDKALQEDLEENENIDDSSETKNEIPEEIKNATPKELADMIIVFKNKEYPDARIHRAYDIASEFFARKNINVYDFNMPLDLKIKVDSAKNLIQERFNEEEEIQRKQREEKEKLLIPSLAEQMVNHVESKGVETIFQSDVDEFLDDIEVPLSSYPSRLLRDKVQDVLMEKRIIRTKERLDRERTELPSLVTSCVEWANLLGLQRVTQTDVEVFLIENKLEALPTTLHSLTAMVNLKLKSCSIYAKGGRKNDTKTS